MHAATHLTPVSNTRLWAGRYHACASARGRENGCIPSCTPPYLLRQLAETKGVHEAREASGHPSDRSIWRSVKPDQQTLADAMDELE